MRRAVLSVSLVLAVLAPATLALPVPVPPVPLAFAGPGEEPDAGGWRTWVLASPADVRPPPPPALDSAAFAEEALALQRARLERTEGQLAAAGFWDTGPATQRWTEVMLQQAGAYGPNPPRVARGLALLHIAMYDAVIAAWDAKQFFNRAGPAALDPTLPAFAPRDTPSYPSEHAVVAGAASRVLQYLYGANAGFETFAAKEQEAAMSRLWAGVNWPSDVAAGLDLGHAVADKVLARAAADRSSAPWDGKVPAVGPCLWHPTPPAFTFPPLEPTWGQVKPWLMANGSQFRAPPPPACNGAQWEREHEDLYAKVMTITPEERAIALYWADGPNTVTPPGHWFVIALDLLAKHPLSTPRAARALAYLGAVEMDAGIAVWDTKYAYWVERPVEWIREELDPAFTSVIGTPPFPGYVSGHSGFSAAGARWLGHVFPEEAVPLRAMAFEAAMSRFYAGIHIMADNLQGMDVGRSIGDLAIARAMADGAT